MHTGPSRTPNQIVEIPNKYPVTPLIYTGHDQVPYRQVHTLGQRRGADDKTYQACLHAEFDREPQTVRNAGVMREDAKLRRLRCRGSLTDMRSEK